MKPLRTNCRVCKIRLSGLLLVKVINIQYTDHNRLLKEFRGLSFKNLIQIDIEVFMYKAQNGMVSKEFSQLFVSVGNIHGCLTRSALNGNLLLPKMKLTSQEEYKDQLALVQSA